MRMYDILHKKRDGLPLSDAQIAWFVEGYTAGNIPDYQASALLMAIFLRGMTEAETAALTMAMARSGDTVDLSAFGDRSVDKHSTGGVGDKTTLIVAPVIAALGGKVTKMSGRGLGHTGGTVDKLEAIPGYRTTLSPAAFLQQAEDIGVAVIGQSGNLAPADKKLYALRDVTATVDSIPLITASIMSKKLAAGSKNIVLDVKVGSGAFMKTAEDARALAAEMVKIGKACGRNTAALITDMDTPLGNAVGNILEVKEAIAVLRGESGGALRAVCEALATEMLVLFSGMTPENAEERVRRAIDSGAAFAKLREWIRAQGGDVRCIDDPARFACAPYSMAVKSTADGFVTAMNAEEIGAVASVLGAGRVVKTDTIDPTAGILLSKKTGDRVTVGETLCTLYTGKRETLRDAAARYVSAITVGDAPPEEKPLIYDIVR